MTDDPIPATSAPEPVPTDLPQAEPGPAWAAWLAIGVAALLALSAWAEVAGDVDLRLALDLERFLR